MNSCWGEIRGMGCWWRIKRLVLVNGEMRGGIVKFNYQTVMTGRDHLCVPCLWKFFENICNIVTISLLGNVLLSTTIQRGDEWISWSSRTFILSTWQWWKNGTAYDGKFFGDDPVFWNSLVDVNDKRWLLPVTARCSTRLCCNLRVSDWKNEILFVKLEQSLKPYWYLHRFYLSFLRIIAASFCTNHKLLGKGTSYSELMNWNLNFQETDMRHMQTCRWEAHQSPSSVEQLHSRKLLRWPDRYNSFSQW